MRGSGHGPRFGYWGQCSDLEEEASNHLVQNSIVPDADASPVHKSHRLKGEHHQGRTATAGLHFENHQTFLDLRDRLGGNHQTFLGLTYCLEGDHQTFLGLRDRRGGTLDGSCWQQDAGRLGQVNALQEQAQQA